MPATDILKFVERWRSMVNIRVDCNNNNNNNNSNNNNNNNFI